MRVCITLYHFIVFFTTYNFYSMLGKCFSHSWILWK